MDLVSVLQGAPSRSACRTGLLREEPGGWCAPKTRGSIDIDHEKKVDLGVLRGADHDRRVPVSPFSTVDGVCVKFKVTLKLW